MDSGGGDEDLVRVVAASRLGSEHRRVARNNQDAWAVRGPEPRLVLVVTDGCSMGPASEVGAGLAAAWIAERVARDPEPWRGRDEVQAKVGLLARALDGALGGWIASMGEPAEVVSRYFLFSYLCAVLDGDRATVFGCGDGVWSVDGRASVIDPGPDNAPPYAAYRVLPAEVLEPHAPIAEPVVHHHAPLARGSALYVTTDGAIPLLSELPAWLADPVLWRSARALERRLNVHEARLPDDTTIAALVRGAPCG